LKTAAGVLGALAVAFLLLCLPPSEPTAGPAPDHDRSFAWRQDALWRALEARYVEARAAGCDGTGDRTTRNIVALQGAVTTLFDTPVAPGDATLDSVEARFFALGPAVAACPRFLQDYLRLASRMREAIKRQSRRWDVSRVEARDRLYRALYGGRAAVEEVMLQHPDSLGTGVLQTAEPSTTPSADVHGVTIHSGDILVSRGGYPTSALIARGNDYPGNFSHIGLVHVDAESRAVSVIEAHIEQGVAVATAEQYLADKNLRLMVLRPRADLPQLTRDPMLPHRAASLALERARAGHIPYDFEMDYTDPSRVFCSEVASWVYRELGVNLWMGISTISKPGLRRWLASFGVRHFETQEPSDLEYDPQLVVVAEWRDVASLFKDHIDNAVIDAMLEGAERGDRLAFSWFSLPAARVGKGLSWLLERIGHTGPVPEGMSAAAALRNKAFSDRERRLALRVSERAARLTRDQGYPPPYWALLDLAREAARPTMEHP
jgi:hypothetical protein